MPKLSKSHVRYLAINNKDKKYSRKGRSTEQSGLNCKKVKQGETCQRKDFRTRLKKFPLISQFLGNTIQLMLKSTLLGAACYWTYKWDFAGGFRRNLPTNHLIPNITQSVNDFYKHIRLLLWKIGISLPSLSVRIDEDYYDVERGSEQRDEIDDDFNEFHPYKDDKNNNSTVETTNCWTNIIGLTISTIINILYMASTFAQNAHRKYDDAITQDI